VRRFRSAMSSKQDTSFSRLVSLACHDIRTPLATALGFARTLERTAELDETSARYIEMITAASLQIGELVDELGLAARIEGGRYEPVLREVDSLDLARSAAARLDGERVSVAGDGAQVRVEPDAMERAVGALARCALRHGGLEHVDLAASGSELTVTPITPASEPVVLGEDLRDLGAAVAVRLVRAVGGSVAVEGETLRIRLPT
jgi:signal transduction histidine kinase